MPDYIFGPDQFVPEIKWLYFPMHDPLKRIIAIQLDMNNVTTERSEAAVSELVEVIQRHPFVHARIFAVDLDLEVPN